MIIAKILLIAFYAINLLLFANMHGKPKGGTYNFWTGLIDTGIIMGLLWWGGFFG